MEIKCKMRSAKQKPDEQWGRSLYENFKRNKMFWREVKKVRGDEPGRVEKMRGADGRLLVDEKAVRLAEYFKELLNVKD